MSKPDGRHPGVWWVVLGFVFACLTVFMAAVLIPNLERRDGGDGMGYLKMDAVLFGAGAVAMIITGTVLEVKAAARRRSPIPPH